MQETNVDWPLAEMAIAKTSYFRQTFTGRVPALLTRFHSTPAAFCTCPPKYNINPYLGRCEHGCLYCYGPKFPSFRGPVRPRYDLARNIEKILRKTRPIMPVMLSDCTDPYQPAEKESKITRSILKTLIEYGFPVLIVTKSKLVTRDIDLLRNGRSAVAISITTLDPEIACKFEPYASTPEERLRALERIANQSIPTIARIDPIIPEITDRFESLDALMEKLRYAGVRHVTAATMKLVPSFLHILEEMDQELSKRLRDRYSLGRWTAGYRYLPTSASVTVVDRVRSIARKHSLSFSVCREAFPSDIDVQCDGSHLLRREIPISQHTKQKSGGLRSISP